MNKTPLESQKQIKLKKKKIKQQNDISVDKCQ